MKTPKYEDPTLEALTLTLVNVGCLWCLIWMQFVTLQWFGLPFHATDTATALSYYLPLERWSLSLPELFLIVTVCGVAVLIPAAVCFTRNAQGRLRMLLTIAFFSSLSVGFSLEVLRWRTWHCENARNEIAYRAPLETSFPQARLSRA